MPRPSRTCKRGTSPDNQTSTHRPRTSRRVNASSNPRQHQNTARVQESSEDNESSNDGSSFGIAKQVDQIHAGDDDWEDEEEVEGPLPDTSNQTTQPQITMFNPPSGQPNKSKINITLDNYQDSELDLTTIDSYLHASGRKTRNQIPSDVQKELRNLQFLYRRAKKLLALVAKCSERTINESLSVQTFHTSKILTLLLK